MLYDCWGFVFYNQDHDRQAAIEKLFRRGIFESARFASLVNIGKSITDFKSDAGALGAETAGRQSVLLNVFCGPISLAHRPVLILLCLPYS